MLTVSWKAVTPERTRLAVITGDSYISMSTSEKSKGKTNSMLGFLHNRTLVMTVTDPYKCGRSVTTSCYVISIH